MPREFEEESSDVQDTGGADREPNTGPREPNTGFSREPNTGIEREPNTGITQDPADD